MKKKTDMVICIYNPSTPKGKMGDKDKAVTQNLMGHLMEYSA